NPLLKAQQVTLHWWVGGNGSPRDGGSGPAPQAAGDGPRQQGPMNVQASLATADVNLPSLGGNQCLWVQAALVNAAGQTQWSSAVPLRPDASLQAEAVELRLKPFWGGRMIRVESRNDLHVMEVGKPDVKYDINMITTFSETTADVVQDKTLLLLHYLRYE